MLTIREEQLYAFRKGSMERFMNDLAAHLRASFPERCASFSDEQLAADIRYGVDRAASWGFESRRDVSLFMNLMLFLGREFDQDSGYPWVREILLDRRWPLSAPLRMDLLYSRAVAEFDASGSGEP